MVVKDHRGGEEATFVGQAAMAASAVRIKTAIASIGKANWVPFDLLFLIQPFAIVRETNDGLSVAVIICRVPPK